MTLANEAIKHHRQYGYYKLEATISEITLRESLPTDY